MKVNTYQESALSQYLFSLVITKSVLDKALMTFPNYVVLAVFLVDENINIKKQT